MENDWTKKLIELEADHKKEIKEKEHRIKTQSGVIIACEARINNLLAVQLDDQKQIATLTVKLNEERKQSEWIQEQCNQAQADYEKEVKKNKALTAELTCPHCGGKRMLCEMCTPKFTDISESVTTDHYECPTCGSAVLRGTTCSHNLHG